MSVLASVRALPSLGCVFPAGGEHKNDNDGGVGVGLAGVKVEDEFRSCDCKTTWHHR